MGARCSDARRFLKLPQPFRRPISRAVECAARGPQRVSVASAEEDFSDGEGVGVMFFLMRYQIVVASSREINFARQFFSVSLVHRAVTNIVRQFFEVRLFIIAVQQNFGDAARKTSLQLDCPEFSPAGKLESSPDNGRASRVHNRATE
jgi:hypothetical protein